MCDDKKNPAIGICAVNEKNSVWIFKQTGFILIQ